jgi:SAM-dependent methyltransferase
MKSAAAIADKANRSPFRGLVHIVQFNWPQYAAGLAAIAIAVALLVSVPLAPRSRWLIAVGVAAAAWWLVASLVASWWIYDLSPLTRWSWLTNYLPRDKLPLLCVLNIHSGFDDTTETLRHVLAPARVAAFDLYDPQRMSEPSIHRARRAYPPLADTVAAEPDHLPCDAESADAVLFLLAAHELRKQPEREALFRETCRVLRPGGRVVLVEHARDAANYLAFGPGFMHFLPHDEWLRLAHAADLRLVSEGRMTPFVRFLVFEK